MRIAVLASHFADYSLELAGALAARHEVLLISDPEKVQAECSVEQVARAEASFRFCRLRQGRFLSRWTGAASALRTLRRFRPDFLIAHEHAHPHVSWLQRSAAAFMPVLLIVHDPHPHTGRDETFAAKRRPQIEAQRRNAAHLFAHGEFCASALRNVVGSSARVTSIPHGPILRPDQEPTEPPNRGRMLMFGRMEAYKGLDTLLAAARIMAEGGEEARLDLLGAGPELDRLESQFREIAGVTISNAYASRADLISAMSRCDVVVAPYHEATQSGVLAAAFANGRPVVASRVGGLPDFLRDGVNGRLVPPGDAKALAEALRATPVTQRTWRMALATSRTTLSWEHAVESLVAAGCAAKS